MVTATIMAFTEPGITGDFPLLMARVIALFQEIIFQFILEAILIIFTMDFIMGIMVDITNLYFRQSAFV